MYSGLVLTFNIWFSGSLCHFFLIVDVRINKLESLYIMKAFYYTAIVILDWGIDACNGIKRYIFEKRRTGNHHLDAFHTCMRHIDLTRALETYYTQRIIRFLLFEQRKNNTILSRERTLAQPVFLSKHPKKMVPCYWLVTTC